MSQDRDIVIIGCGAAGGTAAQFARKTDRKSTITIFEKGKYPQYSKCGLPYAISGEVPSIDDLIEFSGEWFKNARIDLLLETTVEKIDVNKKIVFAKKGSVVIEKSYDSLVIATGAKPSVPPIKNIWANDKLAGGVFVVRTLDDARAICSSIKKGKNATIVGAGFIGLEMADNLYKKGLNITIVEALLRVLPNTLDEDLSGIVFDELSKNTKLFTDHLVTKIESKSGRIWQVFIKNNKTNQEQNFDSDILIIGAGCKPESTLAKQVGCSLSQSGYITVNNKCETSVKGIYAVGDCTEYKDFVTKKPLPVGLGSIAVRQGVTAGVNAAGGVYNLPDGLLQTCTSEFFGLEVAAVGPNISNLQEMPIASGKFTGYSRPEYFPGGKQITIKVFADEKTGKIIAAQAVGNNAAKRINTFACAILAGMDVETFRKLETAYAPPIAPTLDAETLTCDIISMKLNRRR